MEAQHTLQVAALHLAHLPTPYRGFAGLHLLRLYYANLVEGQGGIGYVAEETQMVVGFVCGVWDSASLQRALKRRYLFSLVFWGILQVMIQPGLLLSLVRRFRNSDQTETENSGYELRPVVVAPSQRGTGVAAELVHALLADARARNQCHIFLWTEDDNRAANRFYQKVGFYETGRAIRDGTIYVRYERPTD